MGHIRTSIIVSRCRSGPGIPQGLRRVLAWICETSCTVNRNGGKSLPPADTGRAPPSATSYGRARQPRSAVHTRWSMYLQFAQRSPRFRAAMNRVNTITSTSIRLFSSSRAKTRSRVFTPMVVPRRLLSFWRTRRPVSALDQPSSALLPRGRDRRASSGCLMRDFASSASLVELPGGLPD